LAMILQTIIRRHGFPLALRRACCYYRGVKAERAIFERIDLEAEAAADARAEADIKAGRVVDHGAVREWLGKWGTPDETPAPPEWLE
jgi:predicted transcriptional regulator